MKITSRNASSVRGSRGISIGTRERLERTTAWQTLTARKTSLVLLNEHTLPTFRRECLFVFCQSFAKMRFRHFFELLEDESCVMHGELVVLEIMLLHE